MEEIILISINELIAENNRLREALEFYANQENWEYTGSGGQFDWYTTIKNDVYMNADVDEGGGIDYAGKRARKALGLL